MDKNKNQEINTDMSDKKRQNPIELLKKELIAMGLYDYAIETAIKQANLRFKREICSSHFDGMSKGMQNANRIMNGGDTWDKDDITDYVNKYFDDTYLSE
jgi:hypothetical protein